MNTPSGYLGYAPGVTDSRCDRSRLRPALAAGAVALSLLLFVLLGHALHGAAHDRHDAAGAAATGLCLVLFTLLAPLAALRSPEGPPAAPPFALARPVGLPARRPQARARASPVWLQRFLR